MEQIRGLSMNKINPSEIELRELSNSITEGPIAMLNLLRMKPGVNPDEFIAELASLNAPIVERVKAEYLYGGKAGPDLVSGDYWDLAFLVKYPSFSAFRALVSDPEWIESAGKLRERSLAEAQLVVTYPVMGAGVDSP